MIDLMYFNRQPLFSEELNPMSLTVSVIGHSVLARDIAQVLRARNEVKVVRFGVPQRSVGLHEAPASCENLNYQYQIDLGVCVDQAKSSELVRLLKDYSFCHFTYLSTSRIDLQAANRANSLESTEQLHCEQLLRNNVKNLLIIRPAYICWAGNENDQFDFKNGIWCWRGTTKPVYPMITADFLVSTMVRLILDRKTGLVRAGYHV